MQYLSASFRYSCIAFMCITMLFPYPAYADFVWRPDLGKFVSTETEVFETPGEQFQYAEEREEKGDLDAAVEAYNNLYRKFPNSILAQDALFKLGLILEKQEKYQAAFKNYQRIIDVYPQSRRLDEIIQRQFNIGMIFLGGQRAKVFNLPILPALPKAIEVFEAITRNAPFSELGMQAHFNLGLAYQKQGNYEEAIRQFRRFIDNYPTSDMKSEASHEIAHSYYRMSKKRSNDQHLLHKAQQALSDHIKQYPHAATVEDSRLMLDTLTNNDAKRLFEIARFYERDSYLDSAILYYQEVLDVYPESRWAEKARVRLRRYADPEKFLIEGHALLEKRLAILYGEQEELERSYRAQVIDEATFKSKRETLKAEIKEAKKGMKDIEKEKHKETRLRWEVLRRKKRDIKKRSKTLARKEKYLAEHPSPDLEKAIQRWRESIEAEEYALHVEERELLSLERRLGIRRILSVADIFKRPLRDADDIERFKEEALEDLREEEQRLASEKQKLYQSLELIQDKITAMEEQQAALVGREEEVAPPAKKDKADYTKALEKERAVLDRLQKQLQTKQHEFKELTGDLPPSLTIAEDVSRAPEDEVATPLDENKHMLVRYEREKRALQQELKTAEEALAWYTLLLQQTEKGEADETTEETVAENVQTEQSKKAERVDKRKARKKVMQLEKAINKNHQIVEDAYREKERFIQELDTKIIRFKEKRTTRLGRSIDVVTKPVRWLYAGVDAFLFGLQDKDVAVRKKAAKVEKKSKDAGETAAIRSHREKIAAVEKRIEKKETEIVALEMELQFLIDTLQDQIVKKKPLDIAGKRGIIEREITENKKAIRTLQKQLTAQEKKITKLKAEREELMRDYGEPEEEPTAPDVSDGERPTLIDAEQVAQLESDILVLKDQISEQEVLIAGLEKAREVADEKKSRRDWKAFWKKQKRAKAKIKEELKELISEAEDVHKDIRSVIDREEDVLVSQRSLIQDKIKMIKKHLKRFEKFQDEEFQKTQQIQKHAFEELDRINSTIELLKQERSDIEAVL